MNQDWHNRLLASVAVWEGHEFGYGQFDCVLLCSCAIDAMRDSGLAEEMKSIYHDPRTGARYIRSHGGLERAVSHHLGESRSNVKCARRGDVVFFSDIGKHGTIGMCLGRYVALPALPCGVTYRETLSGDCYWRID